MKSKIILTLLIGLSFVVTPITHAIDPPKARSPRDAAAQSRKFSNVPPLPPVPIASSRMIPEPTVNSVAHLKPMDVACYKCNRAYVLPPVKASFKFTRSDSRGIIAERTLYFNCPIHGLFTAEHEERVRPQPGPPSMPFALMGMMSMPEPKFKQPKYPPPAPTKSKRASVPKKPFAAEVNIPVVN